MKTLLLLQKHILPGCLFLLCLTGCIKEPGPHIPGPVHKPAWLLSKITEVSAHGDAVLEEPTYTKHIVEFRYNDFYKPALQLNYSPQTSRDTTVLSLFSKDTFYYDRRLRLTQIKTISRFNRPSQLQKFLYNGNDSLPATHEHYSYDSAGTPKLYYSQKYIYLGDTVVLEMRGASKGDTIKYVYQQGNYTMKCYRPGLFLCATPYGGYAGRNVFLYLNLSHMMGMRIWSDYNAYDGGPRISQGNWAWLIEGEFNHYRNLIFNANGLLETTYWSNYYPEFRTTTRFEYKQPE
jgi:hypothetical protein